jgi:tripartite ATP-independent transporter DctM subunit
MTFETQDTTGPAIAPSPAKTVSGVALKILSAVERAFSVVAGIIIMLMMIGTTLDVIMRDFLNSPIKGNFEFQSLMLTAVAYLGISFVQSNRGHITMDVLLTRLSKDNQLVLQFLADLMFLLIAALITWQMGRQAVQAFITGDYYYGLMHFPLWPSKSAIALGTGLLCLRLIAHIFGNPLWTRAEGISPREHTVRLATTAVITALIIAVILVTSTFDLSRVTIGLVAVGLFLVMLALGTPIGGSMAAIGIWGFWLMKGTSSALGTAATVPFTSTTEYSMTVLPLFIVMGSFAAMAGFAQAGFELAKRWLENIRGGMLQATVLGATAFAAATGSSIASCAVLTKVALPEMIKQGIKKEMAIGAIAASATLAVMIPPSGQFVIFGMLTGTSVGQLLIAGIIPGVIGAAMLMAMIYIRCKINPGLAGSVLKSQTTWRDRFIAIPRAWGLVLIAVIIIGGLYTGVFTPTEAGAVGAFVGFVAMFATRKAGGKDLSRSLLESGGISSSVLFILVGGILFGNMIALTGLPDRLTEWIVSLNVAPLLIIVCVIVMYIILGCFMDTLSTMIITLPIIFPIVLKLGFSPIWFGVLMVQNAEIGSITPPFGMNLFVLKGMLKDTTLRQIFGGVAWYIVPMVLTMAIYIFFPQVSLWLPGMMSK